MILNTPNANIGSLKSRLHKVAQVLEEFIEEIENLRQRLSSEAPASGGDMRRLFLELRKWLIWAHELERLSGKYRQTNSAGEAGYSLDLEAARHQIGRRLDRLRQAEFEEEISG